jgi:hypothetical protein
MPIAKSSMADSIHAGVGKTALDAEHSGFGGVFTLTCFDKDGNLKWEDKFHNLVVNQGLQDLNTQYFKGSGWGPSWYLGLVDGASSPTYAAGDTLASHAGWTEVVAGTVYSGARKLVSFGTATTADPSVISNSASPAVFSIIATATIAGAFLCGGATSGASGTTATLFSEGSFTGGNKSVANGDTVNVTYTFSADAV